MKTLRKKLIKVLAALLALVLLSGTVLAYALPDFIPNTPVLYNNFHDALFSELHLSTGDKLFPYEEGSWRYYYWCAYQCQYNADYTVHVNYNGRKAMEVELYDSDGETMLAEDKGQLTKLDTGKYSYDCEFTYSLTEGHLYYYRIAFSGHYYDSCGDFSVSLVSTPGDRIKTDENIILQIGNYENYTYDLEEFSHERLRNDLVFIAIYNDGSVDRWYGSEHIGETPALRGCNIILDYSDCDATVGVHTLYAYYMGRKTEVTFNITGCVHEYSIKSQTERSWLNGAAATYRCSICGKEYTSFISDSGSDLFRNFYRHINTSKGERGYSEEFDLNSDGVINARDFSIVNSIFADTVKSFSKSLNTKFGDENFNDAFDLNKDGVINARDFTVLNKTHNQYR